MEINRRDFLYATSLGAAVVATPSTKAFEPQAQAGRYTIESDAIGRTIKGPDGRVIAGYITTKPADTDMSAPSVCCFHPLMTPAGERVTVFGMGHQHYRGVFFGWHTVEFREPIAQPQARGGPARGGQGAQGRQGGGGAGARGAAPPQDVSPEAVARGNGPRRGNVLIGDYWGWGRYAPLDGRVIKSRDVRVTRADVSQIQLDIQNDWTIAGQTLMQEGLTAIVHQASGVNLLDLTYRFTPRDVDIVLPEWSFGGLCVSGRSEAESAYYEGPTGRVERPNPSMFDGNTDSPEADWYSRTHTLAGKTAGYAVVNHPSNPRTRWWNPPTTGNIQPSIVTYGDVSIPHDQSLTLRYRVVAYDGVLPADRMNQLSNEFRSA